jgi:hypothetical protein
MIDCPLPFLCPLPTYLFSVRPLPFLCPLPFIRLPLPLAIPTFSIRLPLPFLRLPLPLAIGPYQHR